MYKRAGLEVSRGRFPLALRWVGRGRKLLAAADSKEAAQLAARLTARYTHALRQEGRWVDAARSARRAIEEAEASGALDALADALNSLAVTEAVLGRPEAEEHWRRAEGLCVEIGDLAGQALALMNLGALAYFRGRWEDALALYEEARDLGARIGDPVGAAIRSMNAAEILIEQGRPAEAGSILSDLANVFRAAGDRHSLGFCLAFRGRAELRIGRVGQARSFLEEARLEFERAAAQGDIFQVEAQLAECHLFAGEPKPALDEATALLERARERGDAGLFVPSLLRVRGYALAQMGDLAAAREAVGSSLAAARAGEAEYEIALSLLAMIRFCALEGASPPRGAGAESAAIVEALGIVAVPAVPLGHPR
jgi:tetratricopeptide (TPR) repeat protein